MSIASPVLERIARGDLCSGCGGCAAVAPGKIDIVVSKEGFHRPNQRGTLTESEERRLADICPGLELKQESGGREDHTIWGPMIAVRKGYATNPDLRRNGSSGGVLSAILVYLLESCEVDSVLHTAAAASEPLGNVTVLSRTAEEVFQAAGSRYAPSSPLAGLQQHLAGKQRFAFVGKPCDVAALRALARQDPRINARIPYAISFFCAGVPSRKGAVEILQQLGVREEEVIAFRYRGDGWPGRATATLKDGNKTMSYRQSWGGILTRYVQFRCRICPDGSGGFADIVCADAWHCDEAGYPLFDEADGLSLVVTRSGKGERLLQRAMDSGHVEAESVPVEAIAAMQPGQLVRKQTVAARLLALRTFGQPRPRYLGFHLEEAARGAGGRLKWRHFVDICKRVARRKVGGRT